MAEKCCALCGARWESEWSEAEVEAEYRARFPAEAASGESRAIVCDDCYRKAMKKVGRDN